MDLVTRFLDFWRSPFGVRIHNANRRIYTLMIISLG